MRDAEIGLVLGFAVIITILLTLTLTRTIIHDSISAECEKLGRTIVNEKAYECRRVGGDER